MTEVPIRDFRNDTSGLVQWDMRISPVTLAEHRPMRLRAVELAVENPLLTIDEWVADEWAALRSWLDDLGRGMDANDLWLPPQPSGTDYPS
jgi:predicted nucleic acid-binding protein